MRSQIAKKQPMAPMSRKTLTPPFLSEQGKFSLGFRHPVVLRGQSNISAVSFYKFLNIEFFFLFILNIAKICKCNFIAGLYYVQ